MEAPEGPSCESPAPQEIPQPYGTLAPAPAPPPAGLPRQRQGDDGRWPRDAGRSHCSGRSSWPGLALPGHPGQDTKQGLDIPKPMARWPVAAPEGAGAGRRDPTPRLQHGVWAPLRVWGERDPRLGPAPGSSWGSPAGRRSPLWGSGARPHPRRAGPWQVFRRGHPRRLPCPHLLFLSLYPSDLVSLLSTPVGWGTLGGHCPP